MKKLFITFLLCFVLSQSFSQTQRKVSTYLLAQINSTQHDHTARNNPIGVGIGLQAFLNNKTKFKPTIEYTRDIYLSGSKVGYLYGEKVDKMVNLFAGSSFQLEESFYVSVVAGPSFINEQKLFGIKPSLGVHSLGKQRWTAKVSYINIFNRTEEVAKGDFGSLSVAIGLKLF